MARHSFYIPWYNNEGMYLSLDFKIFQAGKKSHLGNGGGGVHKRVEIQLLRFF